ncbi:MAG: peptidoglycan-binding protein [Acidimicrobiia bacterium]
MGDGIGPYAFGSAGEEVEAWLAEQFGEVRTWDVVRKPLVEAWAEYPADEAYRRVVWPNGLQVVFSDAVDPGEPGVLRLAAWRYAPADLAPMPDELPAPGGDPRLATPGGVALGMTLTELAVQFPSYTIDDDGPCDDPLGVTAFEFQLGDTSGAEAGLRGHPTWGVGFVGSLEAGLRARCEGERPEPPPPAIGPVDDRLTLDRGSLAGVRLGEAARALVAALGSTFGPPQVDHGEIRSEAVDVGYGAETAQRHLEWYDLGLVVDLSDALAGDGTSAPGELRFVAWSSGPRLATSGGGRVGGTIGALLAEYDDVWFGSEACASEDGQEGWQTAARRFSIGTDPWRFYGDLEEWDVVGAVQTRLNVAGADLVVDGIFGNLTKAALVSFKLAHGLGDTPIADTPTLAALGVRPPLDTEIVWLGGSTVPLC